MTVSLAADPLAPAPSAPPATTTDPDCLDNPICRAIFEASGLDWLAEGGYYLLVKPVRIALILAAALILRHALHRMIRRLTRRTGTTRGVFRPLRERMPASFQAATGMRWERRRQRAEALGSVLRSVASVSIFSVAIMLVLGELGVNLAPLIASAGIAGIALGFGAQNLVKDFLAGLFMLLEDQYGVGDVVDLGEASGTVEAVGMRITTVRDARGVLWYLRNGEIVRVGNRSQGWSLVVVDVPVGFAGVEEATGVLRVAVAGLADDPEFTGDLLAAPEVLGVEQITVEGAVVRITAKTIPEAQWRVARDLRRRLTEAIEAAGITAQITANRIFVRPTGGPTSPGPGGGPSDHGVAGAT